MGNNSNFDKMYLPISFKTSPNNDIYRFKSYNVIHPSLSKSADFKSYSNILRILLFNKNSHLTYQSATFSPIVRRNDFAASISLSQGRVSGRVFSMFRDLYFVAA